MARILHIPNGQPLLVCRCEKAGKPGVLWPLIVKSGVSWSHPEAEAAPARWEAHIVDKIKESFNRDCTLPAVGAQYWRLSGYCPNCNTFFDLRSEKPKTILPSALEQNSSFYSPVVLRGHVEITDSASKIPEWVDWIPSPRKEKYFQRLFLDTGEKRMFAFVARLSLRINLPFASYPDWFADGEDILFMIWARELREQYENHHRKLLRQLGYATDKLKALHEAEPLLIFSNADQEVNRYLQPYITVQLPQIQSHCREASQAMIAKYGRPGK